MGTLLVLDISNNSIGRRSRDGDGKDPWIAAPEGPHAIAEALKSNVRDITYMHITSSNICRDKGAILSVNLLKNNIGVDQAESLVSMLKEHPTLKSLCGNKGNETELDMIGKIGGADDIIMLVAEIVGNGAISKFVFSGDDNSIPVTMETCMAEAEFGGKGLGASGAIMLSAFLPKCT
jgi:hypothetical protein